jgi:hypothetical protein
MKLNDELMNKYIDGELRRDEKENFEKAVNSSPELKRKLEALRLLHSRLQLQKEDAPSADFSARVMAKISRAAASRRSQNYFFAAVVGVFSLICLGLVGYLMKEILSGVGDASFSLPDYTEPVAFYIDRVTETAVKIIQPKYFSILGYFAASILVLAGFLFFENIKNLKRIK